MPALKMWKEKLQFLQEQLAISSGTEKFAILKGIEEAQAMIQELEGNGDAPVSTPAALAVDTNSAWNWDDLNGRQLQQLHDAILNAFNHQELTQLVAFSLDQQLAHLVPANANFSVTVFKLLEWAERTGRLKELFDAVLEARPTNALLKQIQETRQPNP